MTFSRITKLALLFGLATTSFGAAQQAADQPLQLTIQQTSPKPTFRADLHNAGKGPLFLHLEQQTPGYSEITEIQLSLTDSNSKTVSLMLNPCARNPDGMCGNGLMSMPDWIIQPGETQSIPIDLVDYSLPEQRKLFLAPGQYTLQAVYTFTNTGGESFPEPFGQDEKSFELRRFWTGRFWTGTVTSNTLPFTMSESAAQQAENQAPLTLTISQSNVGLFFRVDLQNVGKESLLLNLGSEYDGHGFRGSFSSAIDLSLTDDEGRKFPLVTKAGLDRIAGRIDPTIDPNDPRIMTFAPGDSCPFWINPEEYYWLKEGNFVNLSLASGRYTLQAVYTGRKVMPSEHQTEINIWKGTVISGPLPFNVPAP